MMVTKTPPAVEFDEQAFLAAARRTIAALLPGITVEGGLIEFDGLKFSRDSQGQLEAMVCLYAFKGGQLYGTHGNTYCRWRVPGDPPLPPDLLGVALAGALVGALSVEEQWKGTGQRDDAGNECGAQG